VTAARALLGLVLASLVAGCGYRTTRLEAFPAARTIAVLPFQDRGFRRDLDLRLTQAVVAEIRARTRYALAAPGSADLVLAGEMSAGEQVTTLSADREPLQERILGRVEITLTERATGRVVRRTTVSEFAEWRPGAPGESYAGSASDEWVLRMAQRVVQALEPGF
jgi:hypothetical protein